MKLLSVVALVFCSSIDGSFGADLYSRIPTYNQYSYEGE